MGEGIKDKCYELMEYANIANDSYGNYCYSLGAMENYISFMELSFRKAWKKEVESNLNNFKNNSTIEVETETRTHEKKWLNWNEKESAIATDGPFKICPSCGCRNLDYECEMCGPFG